MSALLEQPPSFDYNSGMVEYALVAAAILIAGLCIARRLLRATAAPRGCDGSGGCSSGKAAKGDSACMGNRRELVQLTVRTQSIEDRAEADG